MKIFKLTHVLGAALIGLASFSSCTDACKDVTCDNGGTCVEGDCVCADNYYGTSCADFCANGTYANGVCTCDTGYEGDDCNTEMRTKFVGAWTYTTSCAPGQSFSSTASVVVDNVQRITLTNLTGFNDNTAFAVIEGSTINVPAQAVTDSDGDTWNVSSTTATMSNNSFTLTVSLTLNGNSLTCPLDFTM